MFQVHSSGVHLALIPDVTRDVFLPFRVNLPINDGQWHHIALVWDGRNGTITLTSDGVIIGRLDNYGRNATLTQYGWITLGAPANHVGSSIKTRTEQGFHGHLTRVYLWNRPLDVISDIPKQVTHPLLVIYLFYFFFFFSFFETSNVNWIRSGHFLTPQQVRSCQSAPMLFDGLLLQWSGYDRIERGVERVMPSACGQRVCPLGTSSANCGTLEKDKVPPKVVRCPGDVWIETRNGSARVDWQEPQFSDNVRLSLIEETKGIHSGNTLGCSSTI